MLNEIREALENLQKEDELIFGSVTMYGKVTRDKVPDLWNYITFNRINIRNTGSSLKDYNLYFQVNLVHEDYIPEECVFKIVEALNQIKGLKRANQDIVFDYTTKASTDTVVEVASITFTQPLKGIKVV